MNRQKIAGLGLLPGLFVLGFSDTGLAQNAITTDKSSLTYTNVPQGSLSAAQTIQVTTTNATTVVVGVDQPWLIVNQGQRSFNTLGASPSASVPVQVDAHSLPNGATPYNGTITFTINQSTVHVAVTVSATVSASSVLVASQSSVAFTAVQGANVGTPQAVTVNMSTTNGTVLSYNSIVATSTGGNWLLLTNPSGTTGGQGITVSVNPSGLTPGAYTGTVTVNSTSTSDSAVISVTFTVTANATLSVSPTTLPPFLYQIGQATPSAQTLTLTASSGSVNFSISTSTTANWLIPNITSGTASPNQTVSLSVNPNGLNPGVYSTSLIITPSGGSALAGITVTLVVSNNPLLKLSANALSFNAQFAGQNPPDQQVQVTTTGGSGSVGFTFSSDSSWLSVPSPTASTTPATLTVHVNTQSLQVGTLTGTIKVSPTNGDNYSQSIVVTLTVGNASTVVAGPPTLLFSFETSQSPPPSQLLQLTSLGQPTSFTLSTSGGGTCGNNWLQATSPSTTTPATVAVSVVTTGLPAGICSGTVTASYNSGSGNIALAIPVTLQIATTALLNVSFPSTPNGFGLEVVQQNASTITRSLSLTSTDPNTSVSFSVSASSGANNWLFVSPSGFLQTPQTLSVAIVPAGLTPGTYSGTITISPGSNPPSLLANVTIPITLVVNPNVTVTVTPAGPLTFTVAQNGPAPPAQSLTLASSGGTGATFTGTVTAVTGGTWVQISPTSGAASGSISVSLIQAATAALSQGAYTNQITLAFQNSATAAITIAVNLTVGPPQTVSVSPTSLSFSYQIGSGQSPASQTLQVTSTGGAVQVSVGATSSGWLSASPTSGSTPLPVSVQVNTQGLPAGTLNGTVSISAPGVLANPITVNVTLTVTTQPLPSPLTITNSGSSVSGAIAPGELITIKGTQLGPSTAMVFKLNAQGGVDSTLGGVQVLFDNIPGTPIYVSPTQINAIAPYEIAGRLSTSIVVVYQNQQSPPIQQIVATVAPGTFTLNTTGQGQGAVLNQNGTINGPPGGVTTPGGVVPTSPAPQGTVIAVYATGGGQTSPASTTGSVAPTTSLRTLPVTVTATIGGVPATVTFAGSAPGLVSGVIQVNVQVPTGVTGSDLPIVLTVNNVTTPLGVTVAVQ